MKIKINKKLKVIILTLVLFFTFFWVLAPAPNWNLPSELIYRFLLPKYPNAKNIQNTLGCGFEFEVEENELKKGKKVLRKLFDHKNSF